MAGPDYCTGGDYRTAPPPHRRAALPLQAAVVRRQSALVAAASHDADDAPKPAPPLANETGIFVLLALVLSLAAGIGSIVVVHLLIFLQARGVEFMPATLTVYAICVKESAAPPPPPTPPSAGRRLARRSRSRDSASRATTSTSATVVGCTVAAGPETSTTPIT